jgi:predicted transcriptional regulator
MNIQVRKLNFIEEYLRLGNQSSLEKLEALLKKERKKELASKLKPISIVELRERIKLSEEDIKAGRVYTHDEVKARFKNKFKVR